MEINLKTEICVSVITFNWTINNFSKLSKEKFLKSPTFHLDSTHEFHTEFKMNETSDGFLMLHISGPDILVKHHVYMLNKSGTVLWNLKTIHNYTTSSNSKDISNSCISAMKEALKENALTFKCVFEFDESPHHSFCSNPVSSLEDMSALSKDLGSLYEASLHPDITLKIGDCLVPAHKNILAARSSVFARMFETPMEETEKNMVNIPDLDSNTVRGLISYLYTAVLPCDDFDSACSLYYAGDKYNVPSLRGSCRSVILSKMDIQNVCRVLSLADQHSDKELKNQAMQYIDFHFEDVLLTELWTELIKSSNGLAVEVLVFCSRRSKKIRDEKVQE